MTKNPDRPREYDAVLGNQNIAKNAPVLGGIESVKQRFAAEEELIRVAAVEDAMKYGDAGLEVAIAALKDKSPRVRQKARDLLEQRRSEPKVKAAIASNYKAFFQRTITSTCEGDKFLGEMFASNKLIRIYRGDITNLVVDVIVTSSDKRLKMTGSISERVRRVGGEEIYNQVRKIGPIGLGQVAVTTAGKLRARTVFHPAVIDWSNPSSRSSPQVIKQAVRNCMAGANEYNLQTIAFPLLGTGAGCLDPEMVGEAMLSQLKEELSQENQTVKEVAIALYGRMTVRALNFDS
ncbi:MAG: macro domain-containing protein [Cyanobacteriota bacterium]|nr:macro domain-containing protein [Cyanobacteriota bacterium]